ncbi:hypothetical protein D3C81_2264950 [compost metagenome]
MAVFNGGDELARFEQGFMRARIEPGHAAPHQLDVQLPALQIGAVDIRDFQFATC